MWMAMNYGHDIPATDLFLINGLAAIENGRFFLRPRGWLVSNQLFQHFVTQPA